MTKIMELWVPAERDPLPEFKPMTRYFAAMDCLIYLKEECPYRAVRLNTRTTVLLHPYEDRAVGVKVKGVRYLHEKLKAILVAVGFPAARLNGISLIAYWELALTDSGDEEIQAAEKARQQQLVGKVQVLVEHAGPVEEAELQLVAA